ncbi:hypothetical protein KWH86_23115, partial [Enterobacter cloacae]|uniref:hypothetical protein n=1 Tax=Enterobacter cloacae TaxID=550 RepID=UPI0021D29A46
SRGEGGMLTLSEGGWDGGRKRRRRRRKGWCGKERERKEREKMKRGGRGRGGEEKGELSDKGMKKER